MIFMFNKRQGARANSVFCNVSYKCIFCMVTPMHKTRAIRPTAQLITILKCAKFVTGYAFKYYIHFNPNRIIRKIFRIGGRVVVPFSDNIYNLPTHYRKEFQNVAILHQFLFSLFVISSILICCINPF